MVSKVKKSVVKLDDKGKRLKYEVELLLGEKITNTYELKKDRNGNPIRLSDRDRSYRVGYLAGSKRKG